MDEYIKHDVRNYHNAPMMIFVMNIILYVYAVLEKRLSYCDLYSGD